MGTLMIGYRAIPILLLLAISALANAKSDSCDHKHLLELRKIGSELKNSYQHDQAIERSQLAKRGDYAERHGKRLELNLRNGAKVTLIDSATGTYEGTAHYSYIEWLDCVGFHLVSASYYEGGAYLFVSGKTGKRIGFDNIPVFSPDRRKIAVGSEDLLSSGYRSNAIEIWKLEKGEWKKEWQHAPSEWGPGTVQWNGNNEIRITKLIFTGSDYKPIGDMTLRFTADQWQIVQGQ